MIFLIYKNVSNFTWFDSLFLSKFSGIYFYWISHLPTAFFVCIVVCFCCVFFRGVGGGEGEEPLYHHHLAIVYLHFRHLPMTIVQVLLNLMQLVTTATNENDYLVHPKFPLKLPKVETRKDCNCWIAKIGKYKKKVKIYIALFYHLFFTYTY